MQSFKDIFNNGMNVDSPQFEVSFNNPPKQAGGKSTATIDFKVYYEPFDRANITSADMAAVRDVAYQGIRDRNLLTIPVLGDGSGGGAASMVLKSISAKPIAGTDIWEVTAKYDDSRDDSGSTNQELTMKNFQFSTQGRTSHIVRSLETMDAINFNGNRNCYNFQQMIGFVDGEFAGVDVKRPNLTFSRDIWILHDTVDFDFIRMLSDFTGSVNADYYYGFNPGTVLFTGVSQGQKASLTVGESKILYWNITLAFETSPNDWVDFGGGRIFKAGWDYIWYLNQKTTLSSDMGQIVSRVPIQATVERVYPYRSFCDFFGFGWTSSLTDGETVFNG